MKAILISIKPEWVAKILNGEKDVEIRKTAPTCDLPIEVLIYCTKGGRPLVFGSPVSGYVDEKYVQTFGWNHREANRTFGSLNGKVVAKFTLSKIERVVSCIAKDWGDDPWEMRYALRLEESDTAHNDDQLIDEGGFKNEYLKLIYGYLGFDFPTGYSGFGERPNFKEGVVYGYAWHIDDLEIFDEPKELSEFKRWKDYPSCEKCPHAEDENDTAVCENHCRELLTVKRAPESWSYVEEK